MTNATPSIRERIEATILEYKRRLFRNAEMAEQAHNWQRISHCSIHRCIMYYDARKSFQQGLPASECFTCEWCEKEARVKQSQVFQVPHWLEERRVKREAAQVMPLTRLTICSPNGPDYQPGDVWRKHRQQTGEMPPIPLALPFPTCSNSVPSASEHACLRHEEHPLDALFDDDDLDSNETEIQLSRRRPQAQAPTRSMTTTSQLPALELWERLLNGGASIQETGEQEQLS